MEIRKIISAGFIFLVLLSTLGYEGPDFGGVQTAGVHKGMPGATQLSQNAGDGFQDFRRSVQIRVSTAKARSHENIYWVSLPGNRILHITQYDCHLQKFLSTQPSARLFIDLGALII